MSEELKLNPQQQERLEKWRKNVLPGPSAKISQPHFHQRGDYGDDVRDFEEKQRAMWVKNNEYSHVRIVK